MQPLIDYIYNKNGNTALELGCYHEDQDQLAGAISYYLEAADLTNNPILEYESILRAALCFEKQGGREGTMFNLLYRAVSILPTRPEAVFHLLRILNIKQRFYEAYALAESHLTRFSLLENRLVKDCNYPGLHGIEFEKAVAAWWIGNFEEAREIIYKIYINNYNPGYTSLAFNNLRKIGYPRALNTYTPEKYSRLKRKFPGSGAVTSSGQVMQDMFVLTVLNGKRNGTYLEIGSADPIMFNNTYVLEKHFDWKGISIDIDFNHIDKFRLCRNNTAICADATTFNYDSLDSEYDYLQVDCEPPNISYAVLEKIVKNKKFKVITFEHDAYVAGDEFRTKSRGLLSRDYILTVADVSFDETGFFEDWWVHKSVYREDLLGESKKTCSEYFYD